MPTLPPLHCNTLPYPLWGNWKLNDKVRSLSKLNISNLMLVQFLLLCCDNTWFTNHYGCYRVCLVGFAISQRKYRKDSRKLFKQEIICKLEIFHNSKTWCQLEDFSLSFVNFMQICEVFMSQFLQFLLTTALTVRKSPAGKEKCLFIKWSFESCEDCKKS